MSLQAVMAVNTKKRLSGLCKTYRATPKDNDRMFVELKYKSCIINTFNTQLELFRDFWIMYIRRSAPRALDQFRDHFQNGMVNKFEIDKIYIADGGM